MDYVNVLWSHVHYDGVLSEIGPNQMDRKTDGGAHSVSR